ncbi:MAG TPA: hypothetical protein VFF81_08500 [Noviherbaspirillum sp.]|nr:hypothetical protein [Noviherbaspirillum sp.]
MNKLTMQVDREAYDHYRGEYSFLLFVDGEPIEDVVSPGGQSGEYGIPSSLVSNGLPVCDESGYPPDASKDAAGWRLVSACGCGEPGCGHTRCHVRREGGTAIFEHFIGERNHERVEKTFIFPWDEYCSVEKEMTQIAHERSRAKA